MRDLELQDQQASMNILEFVNTVVDEEKHDNKTNAEQGRLDIFELGHGPT
jgi:hypothetical protein